MGNRGLAGKNTDHHVARNGASLNVKKGGGGKGNWGRPGDEYDDVVLDQDYEDEQLYDTVADTVHEPSARVQLEPSQ